MKTATAAKTVSIISSSPLSPAEERALDAAVAKNRKFFGFPTPPLRVIVCHSAAEWRRASRYYYFDFARGVVLRDGTVVLKNRVLAKRSLTAWSKIAAHEINHSYWCTLRGRRRDLWSPIWLVEGLACYVAGNDVVVSQQKLKGLLRNVSQRPLLPYRYRAALFRGREDVTFFYSLWCHFVRWLQRRKRKGMAKLLRQMEEIASMAQFDAAVKRIWGASPLQLLRRFLASL